MGASGNPERRLDEPRILRWWTPLKGAATIPMGQVYE